MTRLEQIRLDRRLTVSQLSEVAGVARKTIARLERTGRAGSPESLHKLAKHLNCTPSELLGPAVFASPTENEAA